MLEVLDYLKRGTAAAGLLFVVAYALGMIALSTFFGWYGLQVSDLLKVRYVCLGLSGVVMLIPIAVCFWWAGKEAPAAKKSRLLWKIVGGVLAVFVATIIVGGTWAVWLSLLTGLGELTGSGAKLPASHWFMGAGWGLLTGFFGSIMLFEFPAVKWHGSVVLVGAVFVMSLTVAITLAEYVPYLPPWAGGLAMGHVQVITHDPDLESILTGRVVVAESTPERYVFWVQGGENDRLVEVPSSLVVAVIGERAAQSSEDGRK